MALTTQCPHCKTTFRVAADQLKLRGGMVRCGSCDMVFDGNVTLLGMAMPSDVAATAALETPLSAVQEASSKPVVLTRYSRNVWREPLSHPRHETDAPLSPALSAATPEPMALYAPIPEPAQIAKPMPAPIPMPRDLHYFNAGAETADAAETPNTASAWRAEVSPEPDFVRQGRRRERSGKLLRWLMGVGSLLLLLALLAQGLFSFRNQLAGQVPALAPSLHAACALLACRIALPTQIEQLSVEQGELQAMADHTYSYATVLHNQSRSVQAWPALELILNDSADQPVLRRVLTPTDYLPTPELLSSGMPAHSEQAIKLYFDLTAIKAAGYHIAIFYP